MYVPSGVSVPSICSFHVVCVFCIYHPKTTPSYIEPLFSKKRPFPVPSPERPVLLSTNYLRANGPRATVSEKKLSLKRPSSQSELLSQSDPSLKSDRPRATGKATTYKVKGSLEEWKGLLKDVCLPVLLYHVWGSSLPTSLSEDCWKENRAVASMYKSSILLKKRRRSST